MVIKTTPRKILDALVLAPIGSVFAWLKSFTNTPGLPDGWVECDGSVLDDSDSVYDGETIPDLNGDNIFVRGNSTSGGTGGSSTHTLSQSEMPSHLHILPFVVGSGVNVITPSGTTNVPSPTVASPITNSTGGSTAHENKPPFYDVVWIMRIK